MSDAPEIFASSSNGDRWGLQHDVDAEALHVVHFANAASGGAVTQLALSDFLSGSGDKPEQKALLRHLGSLLALSLGNCEPMRSVEIRTLRGADLVDVERALKRASVSLPISVPYQALELYNCMLDVMTNQRDIDDAADGHRIAAGFGSTH